MEQATSRNDDEIPTFLLDSQSKHRQTKLFDFMKSHGFTDVQAWFAEELDKQMPELLDRIFGRNKPE